MTEPGNIPIIDFAETSTSRLISTAHIDEPALSPLADDKEELNLIAELESATSAHRGGKLTLPRDVDSKELLNEAHGFGYSYINAAFCYTRSTGNRFSDEHRGAWYATFGPYAQETARAEVLFHLSRELEATGIYDNTTDYQELVAGFSCRFHALHQYSDETFLSTEIKAAYPAGQFLARTLRQKPAHSNGVVYPSQRRKGGQALACFRTNLVQNIRLGKKWRFSWKGNSEAEVLEIG